MTSSQEPQLTRREARERERLRQQPEPSAIPDASGPASRAPETPPPYPALPQSVTRQAPPAPAAAPAPDPQPAYTAPRPAAGYGEQPTPFGGVVATPAPRPTPVPPQQLTPQQQNPFAPRPAQPTVPEALPPSRPVSAMPWAEHTDAVTPERTLTRRELRAMLGVSEVGVHDVGELDLDDDDLPAPSAPPARSAAPVAAQPPASPFQLPVTPLPSVVADGATGPKPVGHWTSQLNLSEHAEPFDQLLSRGGVSHGVPTTTNALILPSLPDSQIGSSVATNGEIVATGSIDLPRSYGSTGVHPSHIDSSDVDRLFDQIEDVGAGAAPVAATRAISTQGASRAMVAPPKKEGMNIPLVLAVTAGVLALGVVATLVIGAIAGLF